MTFDFSSFLVELLGLATQIQERIVHLATAQYIRDNRQNKAWNDVCKEILLCAGIKRAWGCKYVKIVKETFPCYHYLDGKLNLIEPCTHLYACQIENGVLRRKYWIGNTLESALLLLTEKKFETYLKRILCL